MLIVLGKEATPKLLQYLDKDEVRQIAGAAATLGIVDRLSLDSMIDEFAADVAEGPEIIGTLFEAQQLVSGSLAPQEVVQIVEGGEKALVDVWTQLVGLTDDAIATMLSKEPAGISAIVLSKLAAERAAGILHQMEGEQRPGIVAQMLTSGVISDVAMRLLEMSIQSVLSNGDRKPDEGASPARVADVVNRLDGGAVDDVISYLSAVAPDQAAEVRALVFKFEQLTDLSQPDRITLFDGLPTERVILALKGASQEIVEAALSSLGARARRMVESELANDGAAPQREVQAARRMIVQAALRLSATGAIALPGSAAAD